MANYVLDYSGSQVNTKLGEAKVKQTVKSDNVNYKILMGATSSPTSGTAYEAVYDTNITINPSTDTLNIGSINLSNNYNSLLTGTEIRASVDHGSSTTPRYVPGKWVFNTGRAPVDGNIYTIRILSTLTSAGIYISVFGTNDADYHPLCAAGTNRITTQFVAGTTLQVVYESTSSATIYPLDPTTNDTTTVTGIFRVINYYDTNTNTLQRTYASSSANKLPIGGIASNTSMAIPTHTSSYKDLYAGIPATTANRPTVQLSTGLIDVPAGVDLGASKSKLGKLGLYNTSNTNKTTIQSGTPSSAVTLTLPASTGTLALTSEIVKPTMKSISFTTTWAGSGPYTQTVTVSGYTITSNSKVDLQPNEATITQLIEDGVQTLYISNTNGTLTAVATGAAPTNAMTIQCTVTEVDV